MNGALSRTARTQGAVEPADGRDVLLRLHRPDDAAGRASRTTVWPVDRRRPLDLDLAGPGGGVGRGASSTSVACALTPPPSVCGGQVTPGGSPSTVRAMSPVKPSWRKAKTVNASLPPWQQRAAVGPDVGGRHDDQAEVGLLRRDAHAVELARPGQRCRPVWLPTSSRYLPSAGAVKR